MKTPAIAVRLDVEHDRIEGIAAPIDGVDVLVNSGAVVIVVDGGADGVLRGRQRSGRLTRNLRASGVGDAGGVALAIACSGRSTVGASVEAIGATTRSVVAVGGSASVV